MDHLYSYFSFDYESDRWTAKNRAFPYFEAYTNAIGTSLALGKYSWNIFNDSKVKLILIVIK